MFETYLTIVGRVVSEITQTTTANGHKRCGFRLFARERRFDKEAQQWVDGDKVFLQVICWRKLAENVAASLSRGDSVVVTGRLTLNEWEAEGELRSRMELEARAIGPDLSRCTALVHRQMWDDAPADRELVAA
jgi:single-strand DNA-binding protein